MFDTSKFASKQKAIALYWNQPKALVNSTACHSQSSNLQQFLCRIKSIICTFSKDFQFLCRIQGFRFAESFSTVSDVKRGPTCGRNWPGQEMQMSYVQYVVRYTTGVSSMSNRICADAASSGTTPAARAPVTASSLCCRPVCRVAVEPWGHQC